MKKIFFAVIAALGMVSATASFAADMLNGAAGNKSVVMSSIVSRDQSKVHANDMFVLNASSNQIYVQSLPYVNDLVSSNAFDNLYTSGACIPLTIINAYNNAVILNQTFCSRSFVVVRGSYSNVYVDEIVNVFKKK